MSEKKNTPETNENQKASEENAAPKRPALKRNGLADEAKKKAEELDKDNKPPMSKEDTIRFYEENLPFMRLQDEFETLRYNFEERRIKNIELQVREVEAIGFLSQWKAGQDDARRKQEHEEKMKAEWDAMTPEQQEEWKNKAKANLRIMEMQAKGSVVFDGTNAGDILSFVTGELPGEDFKADLQNGKFCFMIPDTQRPGELTTLCIAPDQKLTRTEAGEFIVS